MPSVSGRSEGFGSDGVALVSTWNQTESEEPVCEDCEMKGANRCLHIFF